MELLPIIYWSLVGFGTLTLFVILTSYITYHVRKKFDKVETEVSIDDKLLRKVIVKSKVEKSDYVQHHPKVKRKPLQTDLSSNSESYREMQKKRITILNDHFKREDTSE